MVTVNNGLVTAVAPGTATVRVQTNGNNRVADCIITVKKRVIEATSVFVEDTILAINKSETGKIKATVEPSNTTNKTLTYVSNNPNVATVSADGTVTGVYGGEAEITVESSNGKKAFVLVKVVMSDQEILDDINLPTETSRDLDLPTSLGGKAVSWETSSMYVIKKDGKINYDKHWLATNNNPATLTATIGEKSKSFVVKAKMPEIVR